MRRIDSILETETRVEEPLSRFRLNIAPLLYGAAVFLFYLFYLEVILA